MRISSKLQVCECCGKKGTYAKGLCRTCYQRKLRTETPQKAERACKERDDEIIEMWRNGATFEKIGRRFGISRQAAYASFRYWYKPSNADNIRTKSDEELARYLGGMGCPEGLSPNSQKCPIPLDCSDEDACYKCWLDWLKKEAINESND